jgi:hypothetical protein
MLKAEPEPGPVEVEWKDRLFRFVQVAEGISFQMQIELLLSSAIYSSWSTNV